MEQGHNFQTPSRQTDKEQMQTTLGQNEYSKEQYMAESKYERQTDQNKEDESQINAIEAEIKDIGTKLETLHGKMAQATDKYSEEYMIMEEDRNCMRKRLMDLDYRHKTIFASKMRESRFKEEEEKDQIRKEYEEKESRMRSEKPEQKQEQKPDTKVDELADSRRKVRIAEIEAEIAQSSLRRSRAAILNSELDYLRYSYRYPYYTWDYYSSLSRYPYYSSYYSYPYYRSWWLY